jgi:methyl-accepting chemotaxis protein
MFGTQMTLFRRLTIAFLLVAVLPMLIATYIATNGFLSQMDIEASRTIEDRIGMAHDVVDASQETQLDAARAAAASPALVAAVTSRDAGALRVILSASGLARDTGYAVIYGTDGVPLGGSAETPTTDRRTYGPLVEALNRNENRTFDIIPDSEIAEVGLSEALSIEVKPTDGGTVIHETLDGVLASVVAVPVYSATGQLTGALISVAPVNRSSVLVDRITARGDGAATIFQHEVRVSTTVLNAEGNKAYGTVVADRVRETTLEADDPFRGKAQVVGQEMMTAYDPIVGPDGETIGMLFVGLPMEPYIAASRSFMLRFGMSLLIGLAAALFAGSLIARRLSAPLSVLGDSATAIAGGDLTVRVPAAGTRETVALGEAFNSMALTLSQLIGKAMRASEEVRSSSEEIKTAVRVQSEGAGRQASAVSETTATLEEMAATYRSVANSAERVLHLAEDALKAAETGEQTLESTIEGIGRVANDSEQTQDAAERLAANATDIMEVLGIIDSIAAQTKILALNAAIEAARAGEAGHGFAVVATEIRTLAESVTDSTSRIGALLHTIHEGSNSLARAASRQSGEVSEATERGRRSEEAFVEIVDKMSATAAAAREIATAADQQRAASEQVVQAMHQVTSAASDTASAARQVEGAVEDIASRSEELERSLKGFRA